MEEAREFADLLESMLEYNVSKRSTAAACLNHPFLLQRSPCGGGGETDVDGGAVENEGSGGENNDGGGDVENESGGGENCGGGDEGK